MYIYIHTYIHTYIPTFTHIHVCICIYIYTCVYLSLSIYIYIYIYKFPFSPFYESFRDYFINWWFRRSVCLFLRIGLLCPCRRPIHVLMCVGPLGSICFNSTANLRTHIVDFRGFDPNIILM